MMPPTPASLLDWAQRLADVATQAVARRVNEAELRLSLNPVIVDAAQSLYGLDPFASTAERSGRQSSHRYDNLYGSVVVEWEWKMGSARREHGAQQALDYLASLRNEAGNDIAFTAVVTDGQQWGFLVTDPASKATLFENLPLTAAEHFDWRPNDVPACRRFLELIGSHRQRPITPATLLTSFGASSEITRRLIILLMEGLAGRNLDHRTDILYREWRRALDVVYGDLDTTHGGLAEIVAEEYGLRMDRPAGEYLFALHTYFALIASLFAIELLAIATEDRDRQPSTWSSLPDSELVERFKQLNHGDLPGGLNIANLYESDVFGWWLTICEGNVDLLESIRRVLSELTNFAFPRNIYGPQQATDVLSDLYQSLVPRQMRRRLGEFLTPRWLAGACLSRLSELGAPLSSGRVIDPTCGTGTFLTPILAERVAKLRRGRPVEEISASEVQLVLDSVAGIDINPVAVTAARANYVLALGELARIGELVIPIWRADSLLVPDAPPRQGRIDEGELAGREFRELNTSLGKPFRLPPLLATADRMATLRKLLDEALLQPTWEDGRDFLLAALDNRYGPSSNKPVTSDPVEWENERVVISALYSDLRKLEEDDKNGIWSQIIANAYAPLFAGRFDVVVGNPPWVAWGRLPIAWRTGSERLWQRYGLWQLPPEPGDTGGVFQVSDIAQLVYAVAIDRYAKDGAYIGLLTPLSLLIANPGGRAFRRFQLESGVNYDGEPIRISFSILAVDDWSNVNPFAPLAANKPVFIISKKRQRHSFPVPAWKWHREQGSIRPTDTWQQARKKLSSWPGEYTPANPRVPTSAWSFRRQGAPEMLQGGTNRWNFGVGLHTRGANGIFFVRIHRTLSNQGLVEIENLPSEGRNRNVLARRGQVEIDLVYPLLRGRDVTPWVAVPSQFIIVPHWPDRFDTVLSMQELSGNGAYRRAGTWLRRFRSTLQDRHAPPNRNWNMAGDDWCRIEGPMSHMRGEHLVVVREIAGRPAAAVVERRYVGELARSETPLIEHKLLFCSVPSREEAIYLSAFINSTPAQDFLTSFASTTGVTPTAIRTLPIPEFDLENEDVALLVGQGKEIVSASPEERPVVIAAVQDSIDSAVVRLGQLNPETYQPQQRSRGRRRGVQPRTDEGTLPGLELR